MGRQRTRAMGRVGWQKQDDVCVCWDEGMSGVCLADICDGTGRAGRDGMGAVCVGTMGCRLGWSVCGGKMGRRVHLVDVFDLVAVHPEQSFLYVPVPCTHTSLSPVRPSQPHGGRQPGRTRSRNRSRSLSVSMSMRMSRDEKNRSSTRSKSATRSNERERERGLDKASADLRRAR